MKVSYAIVYASDMDRSLAFYRDVIGLPLRFSSPFWTEFDTEGATLALHAADVPATEGVKGNPAGRCHPGLTVPDLDAFHKRMQDHGVNCTRPPRAEHGVRLAEYLDPDGLPLSVSEGPK
jgi:lactoylglutathione lyase